MSNDLRICRGDKGTLFILRKKSDEKLFKRFQGFIEKIKKKKKKKKKNLASNTKDNF
ncbi:hypothetical protein [Prochlorococcus marinus]|uniref:hypothetical protein n=1 Tax=Prochlorococcus marinus TaxID=1219 RepID=UPI000A6A0E88